MPEVATAPSSLGEFASLPASSPTPTPAPDLGEFGSLPNATPTPTPAAPVASDLGDFGGLPNYEPDAPESSHALAETPIIPRSGTQFDVEEARQYAADPIQIPTVPEQKTTAGKIGAGLANVPIGAANFMLTPAGPPSLALGGLSSSAAKLAMTLIAAQQAAQGIESKSLQDKVTNFVGAGLAELGAQLPAAKGGETNASGITGLQSSESSSTLGRGKLQIKQDQFQTGPQTKSEGNIQTPRVGEVASASEAWKKAVSERNTEAVENAEIELSRSKMGRDELTQLQAEVLGNIDITGQTIRASSDYVGASGQNIAQERARSSQERQWPGQQTQQSSTSIPIGTQPNPQQAWYLQFIKEKGNINATGQIRSSARIPVQSLRESVGGQAPFQQQGETSVPREGTGTQEPAATAGGPEETGAVDTFSTEEVQPGPEGGETPETAVPEQTGAAEPAPEPTSIKNAVVSTERAARGLPEAEQAAARDFGTVWDETAAQVQNDPTLPDRLLSELEANPRALKDTENALLLRKQIAAQNEHDAAIKAVNENPGNADAQMRLTAARDEVQRVYDVGKAVGTETGRGLNARKMLANNDFSLAKMEAETRAVINDGKPLSNRQLADVQALHDRIKAAEDKLAAFEARDQFQAELKAAKAAKARGFQIQSFLDIQAEKARERIRARRGQLNVGIDPTALVDEAIIGASHIARGLTDFAGWSAKMLDEFGERVRPYLQSIYDRSKQLYAQSKAGKQLGEDQRLAAAKKRVAKQTESLREKIASGDLTPPERRSPVVPDKELIEARGQLQREKDAYGKMLERGRVANLSWGQWAAEQFVKGERAMKLTGIHTLGKLGGAGVTRMITTPIEQAVGGILNKLPILRTVAEEAPREGRGSLRAEVGAVTTGLGRGIKDIPRILKGQRPNLDAIYGKQNLRYESGSILDLPGRIHGAEKAPFKEAERERSSIIVRKWAERQGMDLNDPVVQQDIGKIAQQNAQRAIFMQDNVLERVFRTGMRSLETSKQFPGSGFILSKLGNFLLPIVKVPTNIALETGTGVVGPLTASGKLMAVMSRGLKNIKPEEADFIMRHYKKGAVGAALFYTGYVNRDNFGGFYVKGKRDPNDVRWGGMKINGVEVPWYLLHAPAFLILQAGATFGKLMDKQKGAKAASLATMKGIAEDIPFIREMGAIDSMLADGYEGNKGRGDLLRSTTVPQFVQDVASMTDEKDAQGNPIRRYPQNELDYIKMGIPGLREDVPSSPPKRQHHSRESAPKAPVPSGGY